MKPLNYNLINGKFVGGCDNYAALFFPSGYPALYSGEPNNVIQVLINKQNYPQLKLEGYSYRDNPNPTKFIIIYSNSNKVYTNNAPSNNKFTFEANKTYIFEPIKPKIESEFNLFSDWELRGRFIDFETREVVGNDYKYNGIME